MIAKNKTNHIGPKALFDPYFIPPKILFRKNEQNSLLSILKDSLEDRFSLNILFQGNQGIGKKVIINKVVQEIIYDKDFMNSIKLSIDCREKTTEELMLSIIMAMEKNTNINLDLNLLLSSKLSSLWGFIKFLFKKSKNQTLLIFTNAEHLEKNFFKKLLTFSKEVKLDLISTVNNRLRNSALDLLPEFDYKKKLKLYNYHQLFSILEQRVHLTFSHEIYDDFIDYLTDLIFEYYIPSPGKGIDILRDLYPLLKTQSMLNNVDMTELSHTHFDHFQRSDDFSLFNYISEENVLTIIFLDGLAAYFLNNPSKYYISFENLRELYDLSVESLEYQKNEDEYISMIKILESLGILIRSNKSKRLNLINQRRSYFDANFFLGINPSRIKAMIDAVFGKI
ncbi:MAG: Cell division control protein 6 [Promethearchaeota archaeon]|nr:MAG: Cell division control protein 6 [Candidatus Lokiarchaeota archaeon]